MSNKNTKLDAEKQETLSTNSIAVIALENGDFLGFERKKSEKFDVTKHQSECFLRRKRVKLA